MIEKSWYRQDVGLLNFLLKPISTVFSKIAANRKIKQIQSQYKSKMHIIVVGNISVGGTGKTPVVRKLAEKYLAEGKKPAIISRGYGAKAKSYPFIVTINTLPSQCGDEPAMLYDALNGQVPIIISPQRVDSVKFIEKKFPNIGVIISDDGLQHYKLARDYEYCVIDTSRMFGNQLCIPAGPLREPIERLESVDKIIVIGELQNQDREFLESYNQNIIQTKIKPIKFVNLFSQKTVDIDTFYGESIIAMTGIGNPSKFFNSLNKLGINIYNTKVFKDHHKYIKADFDAIKDDNVVIMTYKDAVKCKSFAKQNWWYLDIDLDVEFDCHNFV
jgi:tetraacyldisaccharide 4'-kinase